MKEVEWLKSLERVEPPAQSVEVTAGVMRAVRLRSARRDDDRVFPIAALIATIVGVTAAMIASSLTMETDPFDGFGEPLNLVLR